MKRGADAGEGCGESGEEPGEFAGLGDKLVRG